MNELVDSIKDNEGFRPKPYIDILVKKNPEKYGITKHELAIIEKHLDKLKLTFGFGFTYIEEDESEAALLIKIKKKIKEFETKEPFINKLPLNVQSILVEMSYQMGVNGVLNFKNMIKALKRGDYIEASKQMLDSVWGRQMHALDMQDGKDSINRAEKLASMMAKMAEV